MSASSTPHSTKQRLSWGQQGYEPNVIRFIPIDSFIPSSLPPLGQRPPRRCRRCMRGLHLRASEDMAGVGWAPYGQQEPSSERARNESTPWAAMFDQQRQRGGRRVGSTPASAGANLRGTGFGPRVQAPQPNQTQEEEQQQPFGPPPPPGGNFQNRTVDPSVYLTRDSKIDLMVKDMPEEIDEFERWFEGVRVNVCGVGTDPQELWFWFKAILDPRCTPDDVLVQPGDKYALLEYQLYKGEGWRDSKAL